ncbi:hypothetical protein FRB94_002677 [Tulasnella sp. JGI-2019a]|nr:hypothetical protein FRB94_002677 [Tulasnella sp. JGI-2019a]
MAPKRKRQLEASPDPEAGASPANEAPASPPPNTNKRAKTKKAKIDAEGNEISKPEKRLARLRTKCPQDILVRAERVMTQRFFMIDRERDGEELREDFKVLGSTGNVYTVAIDTLPSCNCPDGSRGNHCKHIMFVFLKVLGVSRDSNAWYQKALLTSELAEIFAAAPKNPTTVASERLREHYAQVTGTSSPTKGKGAESEETSTKKRKVLEDGDDCPVCYDSMEDVAEEKLEFCETCQNAIHKECFGQWRATNRGKDLTCVWCRSPWSDGLNAGGSGEGGGIIGEDGYLNLAEVAGTSRVRDTSTCKPKLPSTKPKLIAS